MPGLPLIGVSFGDQPSRERNTRCPCWPARHSDPEFDSVNKFLPETEGGGGGEFIEVTQHAGGTKDMGMPRVPLSV
jgi:hypothetical protein